MLTKLEQQYMVEQTNRALKVAQIDIRYQTVDDWQPGHNANTTSTWSDYQKYPCAVRKVSDINIREYYPYGNLEKGDIVLMIPTDTELPVGENRYQIKYQGEIYHSKTGVKHSEPIGDTFLYYVLIAKL